MSEEIKISDSLTFVMDAQTKVWCPQIFILYPSVFDQPATLEQWSVSTDIFGEHRCLKVGQALLIYMPMISEDIVEAAEKFLLRTEEEWLE